MFKSIMNFIRRLMAPKPGRCPKALDYNWTTQDGDGVRQHEATNTGADPVMEMQAAVKLPKDAGEPRLVPDVKHVRTVKKAEAEGAAVKPTAEKNPVKKADKKPAAKKMTAKKTAVKKTPAAEKVKAPAAAPEDGTAEAKKPVKKTAPKKTVKKASETATSAKTATDEKPSAKTGIKTKKKTTVRKSAVKKAAAEKTDGKPEVTVAVPAAEAKPVVLVDVKSEVPAAPAAEKATVEVKKTVRKRTAAKKPVKKADKVSVPEKTTQDQVYAKDAPTVSATEAEPEQAQPKPMEKK